MRVLAVAGRFAATGDPANVGARFRGTREQDERDLVLCGLLGFRDPLRPEVPAAVSECQSAGVKLKLITGDHALTAHAVAEAAGIAHDDSLIVNGAELARLSPENAARIALSASIFARVQPEQKYQIVDALVRAGEIVAMIGDGINYAPALRRAHIGVSMGRRGTEVARAAADLVLLEDNFAALVRTVRERRRVFDNIQHSLRYLTGFKFALVGLALIAPLLGLPILLLPVVLVWLEMIVHPVSALAFEGEPGPADLMKRPPRDPRAPLIRRPQVIRSAFSGALLTVAALAEYAARLDRGETYARAAAMVVVILGSLFLMWAELAGDRPWWRTPLPRRASFWIVSVLVAASLPIFMALGTIATLLQIAPIAPRDWAIAAALAVVPVMWHDTPDPVRVINPTICRHQRQPDGRCPLRSSCASHRARSLQARSRDRVRGGIFCPAPSYELAPAAGSDERAVARTRPVSVLSTSRVPLLSQGFFPLASAKRDPVAINRFLGALVTTVLDS